MGAHGRPFSCCGDGWCSSVCGQEVAGHARSWVTLEPENCSRLQQISREHRPHHPRTGRPVCGWPSLLAPVLSSSGHTPPYFEAFVWQELPRHFTHEETHSARCGICPARLFPSSAARALLAPENTDESDTGPARPESGELDRHITYTTAESFGSLQAWQWDRVMPSCG